MLVFPSDFGYHPEYSQNTFSTYQGHTTYLKSPFLESPLFFLTGSISASISEFIPLLSDSGCCSIAFSLLSSSFDTSMCSDSPTFKHLVELILSHTIKMFDKLECALTLHSIDTHFEAPTRQLLKTLLEKEK